MFLPASSPDCLWAKEMKQHTEGRKMDRPHETQPDVIIDYQERAIARTSRKAKCQMERGPQNINQTFPKIKQDSYSTLGLF